MTVSSINGNLFTALTSVDGVAVSGITAINGQTIVAGGPTPSDIPNIWEWWEPSREGLSDTDPIGTLTGQVSPGSGHNWTQATSVNKPTYSANQLNGLGVLVNIRTPNESYMGSVNPSALTAVHFWIVIKRDADIPGTLQVPWTFGTATTIGGDPDRYNGDSILCGVFSSVRKNVGDPTASLASWRVVEVVCVSGEFTFNLDGTQLFTSATNTVGIPSNCALGGLSPTVGGFTTEAQYAGVYIFSAKITGADRTAMVDYLNDRFGLSIT